MDYILGVVCTAVAREDCTIGFSTRAAMTLPPMLLLTHCEASLLTAEAYKTCAFFLPPQLSYTFVCCISPYVPAGHSARVRAGLQ